MNCVGLGIHNLLMLAFYSEFTNVFLTNICCQFYATTIYAILYSIKFWWGKKPW